MKKKRHPVISGNARVLRNVNRALILNLIREKQPISRSRIAQFTGMNKSTVSNIVAELLAEGLIFEEKSYDPKIGRNPIHLRLQLGRHLVGAINFDVPESYVAVADLDGSILQTSPVPSLNRRPEALAAACMEELLKICSARNIPALRGVGISIAGVSDPENLTVYYAPRLGWERVDIGAILRKLCRQDCFFITHNDAKAAALAELWFGDKRRNLAHFVYVYIGDGVGAGIVVNKQLLSGAHHAAGEFGHMTIMEHGELCSCGKHGCWEAYASNPATVRRYLAGRKENLGEASQVSFAEILRASRSGDRHAAAVLKQTGYYIGLGVANILKAIDPEVVVIGGEITEAFDLILPEIRSVVRRHSFFGLESRIRIVPSSLKVKPPQLLGAATLAIRELFSDYRIVR